MARRPLAGAGVALSTSSTAIPSWLTGNRSGLAQGARTPRLAPHEARQGGAVLAGQDVVLGGGRARVLRLLRRGPEDQDSALGHRRPGREPPRGDRALALAGVAGRRD